MPGADPGHGRRHAAGRQAPATMRHRATFAHQCSAVAPISSAAGQEQAVCAELHMGVAWAWQTSTRKLLQRWHVVL